MGNQNMTLDLTLDRFFKVKRACQNYQICLKFTFLHFTSLISTLEHKFVQNIKKSGYGESEDDLGFDLGPILQGQTAMSKLPKFPC